MIALSFTPLSLMSNIRHLEVLPRTKVKLTVSWFFRLPHFSL